MTEFGDLGFASYEHFTSDATYRPPNSFTPRTGLVLVPRFRVVFHMVLDVLLLGLYTR